MSREYIEYKGEKYLLCPLAKKLNIDRRSFKRWYDAGMSVDEIIKKAKAVKKKYITFQGVSRTARGWADFYGMQYETFKKRVDHFGKDLESLMDLTKKVPRCPQNKKKYPIYGEELTIREISEKYNIPYQTVYYRILVAKKTATEAVEHQKHQF